MVQKKFAHQPKMRLRFILFKAKTAICPLYSDAPRKNHPGCDPARVINQQKTACYDKILEAHR
jgi:hypothetical protein